MLRRAITRYGLISVLLLNIVAMQTAPLEITSTQAIAAVRPNTGTPCNYAGSGIGAGIYGDIKTFAGDGSVIPFTNGGVITLTQVLNGVANGAVFTTSTTGFVPYTQGGAFYFSSSHTPGFNLQSGDDFILQFHDNSGTLPDLYYPNRLNQAAAMHLHLSRGGGAAGTNDNFPVCDVIDSYGTSSGDDMSANGGALPVLYAGPLVGGRVVQRASFPSTPSTIIQTLTDSDIFNTAVQGVPGLGAAACPWNYILGDVANTPPLPDPRSSSDNVTGCIRPKTNGGTFGTDRQGYYIIGKLPANKYVMLFGATGYQYQAYYYKDMTAPVAPSNKDGIGFQIPAVNTPKIVPLPPGSPSGQRLFNAVLDGASVITGKVTDGRNTCGVGGGSGNSGSFGSGVDSTAVQAYDSNVPGSLVSQANTDSSGNYTMIGLTPAHTYQLHFVPPYYNNHPCTTTELNSTEYVSGVTTTGPLSTIVLTTTVPFALNLGSSLSGTISAIQGSGGFDDQGAVQVLVYDNVLTPTQPIYNQLITVNGNGVPSVGYTFPRLFQPASQYKVQFSATGGSNHSYRAAWFSGALNVVPGGTGQQAAINATPVVGGATGVNISLSTGLPLRGLILPPAGGNLQTSNVSVQVNTYEVDAGGPAFVNSFFVQATSSQVISGGYSWKGPAVDPTKSYLVQYIPSPGTTTGFNPVFFASGQPLNSASNIVSATSIVFVNGVSQPSADVTLQLGAEIRVAVKNGNGFPFSGVKVTVLGTKPDNSCDTSNQIQSASSSSYDGTTDFLDIPAPPVGSIGYCVNFQPLGNVAGYLYGSSFSVPASSPLQMSAGQRQSIVVTLADPGATIAGHLYSKDNVFTAADFGNWTIDVVDSNDGSTVIFSASPGGPDPAYDAVVTGTNSYIFNFNIPYASNRPFVVRFNKPTSGSNYTTEYAGSLVDGHSPFSINQANIYSNIGQALTVDGAFLAGAILTFKVFDATTSSPLASTPIRLYQNSPTGVLDFALSTSVTGTLISPLVTAGTYYAFADTPPGSPSYASLWYNQTDMAHATPIVVTTGNDQTLIFNLTQLQGGTPTPTPTPTPTSTPTPTPTPTPIAGAGTVTGNVSVSSNGVLVGLSGATAQAYNLDNTLVTNGSTSTDNSGNYVLTLPPGSYKVYFSSGSLNTAAWYSSANGGGVPDFASASQVGVAGNGSVTANINLVLGQTPIPPGPPPYIYYLPFLANNAGGFTTFLAFQNVGTGAAQVRLTYYNPQGTFLTLDSTCPTLAAQGECIPINSPISSGNKGVGRITSSQPLNVIIAEATPFGGSAYAVSQGASSALIAPLAINNFFGGFITQLTVFNGGNTTATGTVKFFKDDGSPAPANSTKTFSIAPQNTFTLDQSAGDSGLPSGFNGWAQITGNTGSQLVAQVLEQKSASHFVAIANAQNGPHPSVYAPAIFRNAYGGFSTGSNIVNPNDTAVNVNITYYDLAGNGTQVSQFVLAAHAIASIFQGGSGGVVGLPPGNGLPEPYVGAAIVQATGNGVVMVVNELGGNTASGSAKSGVYSAAASGGSSVGLPVIARNGFGYTTGTTIFNTSNQAINGSLQYYDLTGAVKGAALAFTVGPFASKAFFQGDPVQGPPDQFYGTAIITQSSGPANALIITTNALSGSFFYSYTEPNQ